VSPAPWAAIPFAGGSIKNAASSISAPELALKMEYGYGGTIELTARSLAYLQVLKTGAFKPSKNPGKIPDKRIGRKVTFFVPPRPVWRPVTHWWHNRKAMEWLLPMFCVKTGLDKAMW
jgi:hypothetical protein